MDYVGEDWNIGFFSLIMGSKDTTLRVWDVTVGVLNGHFGPVDCVQFHGEHAVSGGVDCTVKVSCIGTLENFILCSKLEIYSELGTCFSLGW